MIQLPSSSPETPVLLFFADISGYTRFVKAHRTTWAHGQYVISSLLESLIEKIHSPIRLAKIEGDALFLYAPTENPPPAAEIGRMVLDFFDAFSQKRNDLLNTNLCHCDCCDKIGDLRLKVILHSGTALFHEIAGLTELSGTDVITLHRLSKTSLKQKEYLLLTESAHRAVSFPQSVDFSPHLEKYDHIGEVATFVHVPNPQEEAPLTRRKANFLLSVLATMSKMLYAWSTRIGFRKAWLNSDFISSHEHRGL